MWSAQFRSSALDFVKASGTGTSKLYSRAGIHFVKTALSLANLQPK